MSPKFKEFAFRVFLDKDASEFTFFSVEHNDAFCKRGKTLRSRINAGLLRDREPLVTKGSAAHSELLSGRPDTR